MDIPVNILGTMDEYSNWRRKLSATLQDMFKRPEIVELENQLTAARTISL